MLLPIRSSAPRALAGLVLAACLSACGSEPESARPNILVVTIDSLRADHMGCYGYERDTSPRMDTLAEEAVLFERAYSHAPFTAPSHASLLTSLHTKSHGVHAWAESLSDGARNLAERFGPAGYRTGAFYNHPGMRTSNVMRSFDVVQERCFEEAPKTATAFLDWVDSGEEPFTAWVHYWDVHRPYGYRDWTPEYYRDRVERAPEDMRFSFEETRFGEPVPPTTLEVGRTEAAYNLSAPKLADMARSLGHDHLDSNLAFVSDRYDGGVFYADAGIGQLVDGLEQRGLLDSTILVITADHGESLTEREPCHFTHDPFLYEETLRVPMIVRLPGGEHGGTRVEDLVRHVDVVPTLHELADLALVGDEQGRSLMPLIEGVETEGVMLLAETRTKNAKETARRVAPGEPDWLEFRRAISDGRFKAIHDAETDSWQLFDLDVDPTEERDLSADPAFADRLAGLAGALDALEAALPEAGDTEAVLTDELEELLVGTGYMGDGDE